MKDLFDKQKQLRQELQERLEQRKKAIQAWVTDNATTKPVKDAAGKVEACRARCVAAREAAETAQRELRDAQRALLALAEPHLDAALQLPEDKRVIDKAARSL
jgi:acyl-CoA reductase-like NAD-dependent aldehyde dehydrogenase